MGLNVPIKELQLTGNVWWKAESPGPCLLDEGLILEQGLHGLEVLVVVGTVDVRDRVCDDLAREVVACHPQRPLRHAVSTLPRAAGLICVLSIVGVHRHAAE